MPAGASVEPVIRGQSAEGAGPQPDRAQRLRRRPRMTVRSFIASTALAGIVLSHSVILRSVAAFLIVDQSPVGQDPQGSALWIRSEDGLAPDGYRSYDEAVSLFAANPFCRILVSTGPQSRLVEIGALAGFQETALRALAARGVSEEDVVVLDRSAHGAWQDIGAAQIWLSRNPNAKVVLLCDRFESGRLRHLLNTVLKREDSIRVLLRALPRWNYDETNWWKSRNGIKGVFSAYVRLVYSWQHAERAPGCGLLSADDYERAFLARPGGPR